jgi:hypothetical protein
MAIRAWNTGAWGELDNWDIAVFDYEIWDALRNVNVLPYPGANHTIPAYDNIGHTRHTGVEFEMR